MTVTRNTVQILVLGLGIPATRRRTRESRLRVLTGRPQAHGFRVRSSLPVRAVRLSCVNLTECEPPGPARGDSEPASETETRRGSRSRRPAAPPAGGRAAP
eukprot:209502-Rhodomonas_salina.3